MPLHRELIHLLSGLSDVDWSRPTVAGSWEVRDVVAHLIDGQMRRLSFQRDGAPPPSPQSPIEDYESLVAYLDDLNADWVRAMRRVSARQLLSLLERVGWEYAEFVAGLNPDEVAFFPVAWAGEAESRTWMDVGREYTELWHHQAQIRQAVGADPLGSREWLFPVLDLGIRAVYRSWSDFECESGSVLLVEVEGEAGGHWSIVREKGRWVIYRGTHPNPTTVASMSTDSAWQLWFNALDPSRAEAEISYSGDRALFARFLSVRAVMV
jgi:uncharacterized protein (TIGR03083 family)